MKYFWQKGRRKIPSVSGNKKDLAYEMVMEVIRVPLKDQKIAFGNPSKYLEGKGWEWKSECSKCCPNCDCSI